MKFRSSTKSLLLAGLLVLLACALMLVTGISLRNAKKPKVVYVDNTVTEQLTSAEKKYCNILFMGTDRAAGLCDVMMLINVNFDNGSTTVVQIPRDTYAEYTDASYKKLNGAYNTLGGAALTAEFLEKSLGIEIHHFMCVGLDTISDAVDAVGGVDVSLPQSMHYSDPEQGLYIDFEAGMTHLDGGGAEKFLRYRSGYVDGDLGRIDAQKLFMAAFFDKLAEDLSPVLAAKLMAVAQGVETDMSASDIVSLAMDIIKMDRGEVCMLTLPGEERVARQSGASYYVLSAPTAREIMKRYFAAKESFDPEGVFENESYDSFTEVYNSKKEYALLPVKDIIGT